MAERRKKMGKEKVNIKEVLELVRNVVETKQKARNRIDRSGRNEFELNIGVDEVKFCALQVILETLIDIQERLKKLE